MNVDDQQTRDVSEQGTLNQDKVASISLTEDCADLRRLKLEIEQTVQDGIRTGINTLMESIRLIPDATVAAIYNSQENYKIRSSSLPVKEESPNLRSQAHDVEESERLAHSMREHYEGQLASLHVEKDRLAKDLARKNDELEKLRHIEFKLRTVVLDKVGFPKISDQQVKDKFLAVRQKIQAIATSSTYDLDRPPRLTENPTRRQELLFEKNHWERLPRKERKNRLRSKIYVLIHRNILDFPCYGLEGYKGGDFMDPKEEHVDAGLRRFEKLLRDQEVGRDAYDEWIMATLNCIESLRLESNASRITAIKIFDHLAPVLEHKPTLQSAYALTNSISALCRDAFEISMMMRRSREGYRCQILSDEAKPYALDGNEHLFEPMGIEGGKNNEASNEVAYVLFGVLTKHPAYRNEPESVLEKAHVILKRR